MRHAFIAFFAVGLALFSAQAPARIHLADLKTGEPAPEFEARDINGRLVRLSDFRGRTVVMEWTNPECPCVGRHYATGSMQKAQKTALDNGAVWIRVNSSAPGMPGHMNAKEAQEQAQNVGAQDTITILDEAGKLGFMYGAERTPHMFIINADGALAYKGAIDSMPNASEEETPLAENYVLAALARLTQGKPVDPAVTEPYGCNVMY